MSDHKHVKSIDGQPKPADIFQPYLQGVELFEDMDSVFLEARQFGAGEHSSPDFPESSRGQRAVAIVTPGRLVMRDPCPDPNTVPENELRPMLAMLPSKSPLNISVISHTRIEALHEDMSKAIPFRGALRAWVYAGHNIMVFEGHPSAFDSGIRDADVLVMDSGMLPFVQFNWTEAAFRVMQPDGRILLHDRKTFGLSIITRAEGEAAPKPNVDGNYVEFLLRTLMRAAQSSVEITEGETVPNLADLAKDSTDRDWLSRNIERDQVNAGKVIDILVQKAGWRWYNSFKSTRTFKFRTPLNNGKVAEWNFTLALTKNTAGQRQLRLER